MTYHNHHYNKGLKAIAGELRKSSFSKAEKRIWKRILSRKQTGVRFLRQRPVDNYIVDFFAPDIGLVIEIDGTSHMNIGLHDEQREQRLKGLGYTILRFSEGIVLNNLNEVQMRIAHAIHSMEHEVNS